MEGGICFIFSGVEGCWVDLECDNDGDIILVLSNKEAHKIQRIDIERKTFVELVDIIKKFL